MKFPIDTVHSVDKALSILEALSRVDSIGISELNRELGFGKGTIYRLITTLRIHGYVEQTETQKYRMSLKLFEMGNKVVNRLGIRKVANPYLEQIAIATNETVNLAVLDGIEVIYIDRIESLEPLRIGLEVGTRFPAYCTGLGRTLLASCDPVKMQSLLLQIENKGQMIQHTKQTLTDLEALEKQLQIIRKQGYCFDDEEYIPGIRCLSAPIFNYTGKVVAAISIAGPTVRLTNDVISNFIIILKTNAKNISNRLGYDR